MQKTANFLATLLALHRLPGMGPVKLKTIVEEIQARTSNINALAEFAFAKNGNCLLFAGQADWQGVAQDLTWAEEKNHHIVTLWDERYPKLLQNIPSAPPLLFVAGHVHLLSQAQIAIVGSRNPTSTGRETACYFAQQLSGHGLGVTSGLAVGIDGAAHRGTLQVGGNTIAVLAGGLDKIYPPKHKQLACEILDKGALVSEFPIGVSPVPSHFPRRNRIISGLSMGTLVVEATLNSGSLITAKYALDQGREVFAIPGSIYSSQVQGCHALIRQGAKLVETPKDVLEEMESLLKYVSSLNKLERETDLNFSLPSGVSSKVRTKEGNNDFLEMNSTFNTMAEKVFAHMGFECTPVSALLERSRLTATELSSILLELEMKRRIEPCAGGYIKCEYGVNNECKDGHSLTKTK